MTLLPIVERELRVAARRPRTFWARLLVALFAILIGGGMLFFNPNASDPGSGRSIFTALAVLAFIYCLFVGRLATADCLTEERREGTLGLLFLTDLKGHDVVLGKIAATSLGALFGLLAVFPVLAITLLMGGVGNAEFWRVVLVLVNTFLFSLSIGIFSSAVAREMRGAMAVNLLLFMLFVIGFPFCAALIVALHQSHPLIQPLFYTSPGYPLWLCDDFRYRFLGKHYWYSMAVIHALTWLFTWLACRVVPNSWQDQPVRPRTAASQSHGLLHQWRYGSPEQRAAYRKRLLDRNAFYWLASRSRFKPAQVWAFLAVAAGWWTWQCINSQGNFWYDRVTQMPLMILLNTTLKLWLVLEATRCIAEVRKIGALELLLSTPLKVPEIIRGQLLALSRQFLRPLAVVAICELILMNFISRHTGDAQVTRIWLAGIFMLFLDAAALSLVGLHAGLKARNQNRAILIAVGRVLVLPWVLFSMVKVAYFIVNAAISGQDPPSSWQFDLGWWFGLGVVTDLFFGWLALSNLNRHFRQLAAERLTADTP